MTDLEKVVQREVIQFFEGLGCRVYRLGGLKRATHRGGGRGTGQTPGLPDLWIFCPRKHTGMWFEAKRSIGGRRSKEQVEFGDLCAISGVPYAYGGLPAARAIAKSLGIMWEAA